MFHQQRLRGNCYEFPLTKDDSLPTGNIEDHKTNTQPLPFIKPYHSILDDIIPSSPSTSRNGLPLQSFVQMSPQIINSHDSSPNPPEIDTYNLNTCYIIPNRCKNETCRDKGAQTIDLWDENKNHIGFQHKIHKISSDTEEDNIFDRHGDVSTLLNDIISGIDQVDKPSIVNSELTESNYPTELMDPIKSLNFSNNRAYCSGFLSRTQSISPVYTIQNSPPKKNSKDENIEDLENKLSNTAPKVFDLTTLETGLTFHQKENNPTSRNPRLSSHRGIYLQKASSPAYIPNKLNLDSFFKNIKIQRR